MSGSAPSSCGINGHLLTVLAVYDSVLGRSARVKLIDDSRDHFLERRTRH